ncbi:MAG: DUF2812 domain-containing protein [Agathobacter sp.]|mgnify:FL=1|nr:DUF2812 domain-containing protein [Agathobacter sp.]
METKKEFKFFNIFEYEKEQTYLQNMHKSGWKFVKVTGLGKYLFEKCVPEDVVYQLDYNQEGLANKDEYLKMFDDCGWEYIQDFAGYSYFRKKVSQGSPKEEIFCDDDSRIQMMERVLKGRMMPLLIIFFSVLLPQFFVNAFDRHNYIIATLIGSVLIMYLIIFITFSVKYNNFRHRRRNN